MKETNGSKITETRKQVDEVTDVMRTNMTRILEREGKLGELELRADQLQTDSQQFQQTGVKLKRQFYWENMKMKILIGSCVVLVIIIIIASVASSFSTSD
ncbi:vesicle-associated membrane protein 2 [Eurytemora carolleeae]|uniref:vesicle-associated membrane protein 2 n=1 Tax=Eurytemora carolleeae TaxID=1294199 RepID=UPI000C7931F6|nr:vesicle-associated membrane protein 2 [Eurytemora carolleeae]|eukprot:XP_023346804.1 vesicle-associated membrane protein 2-like [Eurytemora affinis]